MRAGFKKCPFLLLTILDWRTLRRPAAQKRELRILRTDPFRELCAGKTLEQLRSDWRDAFAFERVMELLGEAVKRLPDELRSMTGS